MRAGIGIDADLDYLLDPQQAKPICFCKNCGREIYSAGKDLCERCEEDPTPRQMQNRFHATIALNATVPMIRGLRAFLDRLGYEYKIDTEAKLSNV